MSDLTVLIITLLLLALLLRIDFIFYIVYVLAGVYLWSRWATPRAFRHLQFERTFTDHAFLRERIDVRLHIRNTGRLPLPWVQISESVPPELSSGAVPSYAFALRGGGAARFTYQVQATRRGYYRLGPLHFRSGDLFGWQEELARSVPSYLTVYPRIIPLSELGLLSRLPFGTIKSQQRLFEDPARPAGVRDYRSGDSLRQINWKVSAHGDNLVVRTLQPAISLETAILLNLDLADYDRRTRYSAPEWAIELAASLATYLVNQKQAVGLMTNGTDPLLQQRGKETKALTFDETSGRLLAGVENEHPLLPAPISPHTGRAHLMKILELLARVEAARTVRFTTWMPRACLPLSWGVTILAIAPHGDDAVCQGLHRLVRSGFNPILIVTAPTHKFGEVSARAHHFGFTAYHVTDEKDLDMWRQPTFTGV
jgi:uncharacterized protein (DUF58 family)